MIPCFHSPFSLMTGQGEGLETQPAPLVRTLRGFTQLSTSSLRKNQFLYRESFRTLR